MTPHERLCFEAVVAGRRHLIEFGAGGSTVAALERGVRRIDSVESDPAWIGRLAGRAEVRAAIAAGRLVLHYADIGPVGAWGYPTDAATSARWPGYAQGIWTILAGDGSLGAVDAVLVDGRFRIACILAAIAHVRPGTPIIVHDFWSRPEYGVVLPLLMPMLRADTLAVFVPRLPVDGDLLATLARSVSLQPS